MQHIYNYFTSLTILCLSCLFVSTASAQYTATHYIAPSPWQYRSTANELIVTTTSTTPVTVTISRSDGTLLTNSVTTVSGTPLRYRFPGTGVAKNTTNTILSGVGLIVSAAIPIGVQVRNIASDNVFCNSSAECYNGGTVDCTQKGNTAFTSLGDQALGTSFRLGYYTAQTNTGCNVAAENENASKTLYIAHARDNNTNVQLNGAALVTLQAGQSYMFQSAIGASVTSNNPIVMMSTRRQDGEFGCGDGVINPVIPNSVLGTQYLVYRSNGNSGYERSIIVATVANTTVTVRNYNVAGTLVTTNNYTLAAAGSFQSIDNGIDGGNSTNVGSASLITTSSPVIVYSGTADGCEVDMITQAPLGGCSGSYDAQTADFLSFDNSTLNYFGYVFVQSATAIVNFNGVNLETIPGVGARRQVGTSGFYIIDFNRANLGAPANLRFTSNARVLVAMVQSGSGYSMSSYISGFSDAFPPPVLTTSTCSGTTLTADASLGATAYQWYMNGSPIPGATNSSYTTNTAGNYSVAGNFPTCGFSDPSSPITVNAISAASVSLSQTNSGTCPNITVTLNANITLGSGTLSNYTWSTGATGITQNSITVPNTAGTYTVTLTDSNGCTPTATITVNPVNCAEVCGDGLDNDGDTFIDCADTDCVSPTVNITGNTSICSGTSATLTANAATTAGTITNYAWSTAQSGATLTSITASTAGSYVVTVTNSNSCTASANTSLVVNALPTVNITGTTSLCINAVSTLTANTTVGGGAITAYLWDNNGGTASTASFTANTTTTYNVTVTDANSCTATANTVVTVFNAPTIVLSGGGAYCAGSTIQLNASGGTGYVWSGPNGFNSNISNPSIPVSGPVYSGQYNVTVTNANGCTATDYLPIGVSALPAAAATSNAPICIGATLNLSASGANSYSWSGPNGFSSSSANPSINNVTASANGTYTVTATNTANGCSATASTFASINPLPAISIGSNSPVCSGNTLNLNASGALNYTWAGANGFTSNLATPSISNVPLTATGNYAVTVTDTNGCTSAASINVTINASPTVTISNTSPVCTGAAVQLTATGGSTYAWSGPSGFTANIANPSLPSAQMSNNGTYSVTVSNVNTCTTVATTNVIINETPTLTLNSVTNPTCFGLSNGSIHIDEALGTAPFTYTWSNTSFGNVEDPTNVVVAGTYSVTVSTANTCTATLGNITLSQPATLVLSLTGTSNVSCNGVCDGSITLITSGGTAAYNYTWSDTNLPNSATPNAVCAGTYAVTVSDQQACTATVGNISITEPAILSVTETHNNVTCFNACDGSITLTTTGGTLPYTFNWSGGLGNTNTPTGLCDGVYSVTVTDANACSAVINGITIQEPSLLTATVQSLTNAQCFNACDGSINLNVVGGTTAYSFQWSNPAFGNIQNPTGIVCAGTYSVTVTDANACSATIGNITITQPTALTSNLVSTQNLTCNTANSSGATDGAIDIDVQGGTMPYNYTWSNASLGNTQDPTGTPAGVFSVTITDLQGCTSVLGGINITEPAAISASFIVSNVACNAPAGSVGVESIDMTVTNGLAPYTYLWSTGETTEDIQNLISGFYTVTITDQNGCVGTASTMVPPPNPVILAETHANVTCFGSSNGSIDLTATGGVQGATGYSYNWSNGAITEDLLNISIGNYCVSVTDANGCSASLCVTITEPPLLSVSIGSVLQATCHGTCNGRATAQASGGTAAINIYTYEWDGGQTTATASGLCAGLHTVTVTDDNGCTATASVTITEPTALDLNIATTALSCFEGSDDGTATATATGGIAPYSFEWSNNLVGASITGLLSGNYDLTVTDANSCTYSEPFFIAAPNPFSTEMNITNATCFGLSDGTISVNPFGGTAPYTYLWSDAQTTAMAVGIPANVSYAVTVTDANGCTTDASTVGVSEPSLLTATPILVSNVSCNGESDGAASVAIAGGTPNYTYLWDNFDTNNLTNTLNAGTHRITVTDNNGCTAVNSINITEPAVLQANLSHTNALCYNQTNGSISVDTIFGGTAPYELSLDSLIWFSNIGAGYIVSDLSAGSYEIWLRDANGCMLYFTQSISQPADIGVQVNGITIQLGESGVLEPSVLNLPIGAIYTWSPADTTISCMHCTTPSVNPTETSVYTLTIQGANGCIDSDTAIVTVLKQRRVFIPTAFSPNSDDNNDVFTIYGGSGVLRVKKMLIFDRWGELVFEQSNFPPADPSYGWDGTVKGRLANTGAFIYYIEVDFADGQTLPYKGDVSLIR